MPKKLLGFVCLVEFIHRLPNEKEINNMKIINDIKAEDVLGDNTRMYCQNFLNRTKMENTYESSSKKTPLKCTLALRL